MNDLRIILLVIGVALIAFIYFRELYIRKRDRRARVESYQSATRKSSPRLGPEVHDPSADAQEPGGQPAYFNLLRREITPVAAEPEKITVNARPAGQEKDLDQSENILVIYITADLPASFKGPEILKAVASADMEYGDMRIFHYFGPDRKHARQPLFSLANITEPGYFVLEDMPTFTTRGLALFLRLPAEMGGDLAFEFMLECAQNLAQSLGGSLRGADRTILDEAAIDRMRASASLY